MKVKALRNCMFSHEGKTYRVKKDEVLDLDVPPESLDTRSFEVVESQHKPKKKKEKEDFSDGGE